MQQIKIRAWDSEFKKMVYEFHTGYYITADYGELKVARYDSNGDWVELEVMLFTGLQDKNKKDIYEGDIVECCRYKSNDLYIVQVKDIRYLPSELFGSNLNYREVIGNIYEHPDRLNQGNQAKVKSLK